MVSHASLTFRRAIFAAVCILAATGVSTAQITTTGIHGIVRDPSGAVVPKASIRLRDLATGIEQATVSSEEGNFAFASLQAATYRLTASAAGFQTAVYNNIQVDAGRTTDVSVQMSLGSTTDTIEVTAAGAQLETTSTEVGTTISSNLIKELPYSGREAL